MQDFLDEHSRTGSAKAKITRSKASAPPKQATPAPKPASSSTDWMADFGSAPAAAPKPSKRRESTAAPKDSGKKPDWMSDFED